MFFIWCCAFVLMKHNGLAMHSNFNDLKDNNMKFETAKEYIEYLDGQSGESWSNATDELADAMEDYAKIYHERQLKLLGIANVVGRSEQLVAFLEFIEGYKMLEVDLEYEEIVRRFLGN